MLPPVCYCVACVNCVDLLFSSEMRDEVREELKRNNPDSKPRDVMTKLGELWKQVDPAHKEVQEASFVNSSSVA